MNRFDGRSIILLGQIGSLHNKKLSESGHVLSAHGKMRFPAPDVSCWKQSFVRWVRFTHTTIVSTSDR